jgi:hypothetical protein
MKRKTQFGGTLRVELRRTDRDKFSDKLSPYPKGSPASATRRPDGWWDVFCQGELARGPVAYAEAQHLVEEGT